MNKLISKNPVQRFKQGKKIIKADKGSTITQNTATRQQAIAQGRFNRNYPYSRSTSGYTKDSPRFPAIIQDARFGDYINDWGDHVSGLVLDLYSNNLGYQPPKISVPRPKKISVPYISSNRQTQQSDRQIKSSTDKTVPRRSQNNRKSSSPQLSFKDAFTRARNSGLKEFSWGGRRFNTQKKGEEGFMWSNGRWINPNIKFVVPSPTDMTPEEAEELNRKARPIDNWEGASFAKQGIKLIPRKKLNFRLVAQ